MNNAYDSRAIQQKRTQKEQNPDKILQTKGLGINCCTNGVNNGDQFCLLEMMLGGVLGGAQNYCNATSFFGSWRKLT